MKQKKKKKSIGIAAVPYRAAQHGGFPWCGCIEDDASTGTIQKLEGRRNDSMSHVISHAPHETELAVVGFSVLGATWVCAGIYLGRFVDVLDELPCSLGVTLSSVQALCGRMGGKIRSEYAMVGDVINLAARLMGKAKGRIVCDEVTHDLVRSVLVSGVRAGPSSYSVELSVDINLAAENGREVKSWHELM